MAKSVPYSERKFDRANAIAYNSNYKKENYDRIEFVLPKGYKDSIKQAALDSGMSMSEWIRSLIDEKIN